MQDTTPQFLGVLDGGDEAVAKTIINSRPAIASFLPIKKADGKVVGVISASSFQKDILDTAQSTNRLTFLVTILLMLILIMPIYFIAKRLTEEA